MARVQLASSSNPEIQIGSIAGSLHIKGHGDSSIRIEGQSEDALQYSFQNDRLTLSCDSDCVLRIPEDSSLSIAQVGRDAYISNVEGDLKVHQIGGSLTLRMVGDTVAEHVAGSFTARNVDGNLSVRNISGSAAIRNVEGNLEAQTISGSLGLRDVEGNIQVKTSGNADLRLSTLEDSVHVEAAGNLHCDLRDSMDANIHLESKAKSILVTSPDEKTRIQARTHEFVLGEGGSQIVLKAGGHIDIRSRQRDEELLVDLDVVDDLDNLADEITGQVTQQLESQMEALNQQLSSLSERLGHSGSRAAARAQERVARTQRKLEMKLAGRRRGRTVSPPTPPARPAEPVDTKERAMVLNMLQEKKISIAEAEMLLHALEGRPAVQPPEPPEAPEPPTSPESPTPPEPPTPPNLAEDENA